MRLIRHQRHKMTCGPVAIANSLKKLGVECSYEKALKVSGGARKMQHGMKVTRLYEIARKMGLEVTSKRRATFKQMRKLSKEPGKAVVVLYHWVTPGGYRHGRHYALVTPNGSINVKRRSRVNQDRWRDNLQLCKRPPKVIVLTLR